MQISWRRVAPNELDHELIWLSVSGATLVMAMAWFALRLPWPSCMFRTLTGHPCVTCGSTRSAIAFFHGHFSAAWNLNPLIFSALCAVVIFDAYALVTLTLRTPRFRIGNFTRREKKLARLALVVLLVLNWIYVLREGLA